MIQRGRFRVSNWTFIFLIIFGFQLFRHQYSDAIIFGAASLIMLLQPISLLREMELPRVQLSKRTIWFLVSFVGLAFAYIPRHHQLLAVLFIGLGVTLFLILWNYQDSHKSLNKLEIKSAVFWGTTFIAVSIWELSALIIAKIKNDKSDYPTISELVVPVLSTPITRLQFVVVWVLMGWLVIRHWRHE